jgi:hypothetical protein
MDPQLKVAQVVAIYWPSGGDTHSIVNFAWTYIFDETQAQQSAGGVRPALCRCIVVLLSVDYRRPCSSSKLWELHIKQYCILDKYLQYVASGILATVDMAKLLGNDNASSPQAS